MIGRQQHHERLVEQRLRHHVRLDERRRDQQGVEVAVAQLAASSVTSALLHVQRQLVGGLLQQRDELRQQIGPDGGQRTQRDGSFELVLVGVRHVLDGRRLLEHPGAIETIFSPSGVGRTFCFPRSNSTPSSSSSFLTAMDSVGWLT